MNIQKRIAALALIVFASCQVKEEIHVNTNNSVDRNMELHLDKEAGNKLMAMAKMGGQGDQFSMDSLGKIWNTVTDSITGSVATATNSTFSAGKWDTATNTGKLNFHLPDLKSYNEFANKISKAPSEGDNKMPFSGLQKQQLEWRGKDTLVIVLNEGKSNAAAASDENTQNMAMVKLMLGIDALVTYKASIHLPKAAKSIIATNATLSEDKKTVFIERTLDEATGALPADEVKVVF